MHTIVVHHNQMMGSNAITGDLKIFRRRTMSTISKSIHSGYCADSENKIMMIDGVKSLQVEDVQWHNLHLITNRYAVRVVDIVNDTIA